MAVSQIEEKILGRLAKQVDYTDPLLAASLYQVLGLSIILSRRLLKARRSRHEGPPTDARTVQLHHHIIWLAREGLSIVEAQILRECQDGAHGAECHVMAAKLRASLYHVFCLFHNHPPVATMGTRSPATTTSPTSSLSARDSNIPTRQAPEKARRNGKEAAADNRRRKQAALRDPVLSVTSDASYVTNPYAPGVTYTSLPPIPLSSAPLEARRTPTRPPGLAPVNIPEAQAAASFLLPPLNFVPMALSYFESAQKLADSLLPPAHALRLSVSLEHAGFLWDCCRETREARRLARHTIKKVYESTEGLDDDEFADAAALVQALGGIVRRGTNDATPKEPRSMESLSRRQQEQQREQQRQQERQIQRQQQAHETQFTTQHQQPRQQNPPGQPPQQQYSNIRPPPQLTKPLPPIIDRTISVSPREQRNGHASPVHSMSTLRTPERLSTVMEVESAEASAGENHIGHGTSPGTSRVSSRNRPRRPNTASSTASGSSDKASKRRAVERAEEQLKRRRQEQQPSPQLGITNGFRGTPSPASSSRLSSAARSNPQLHSRQATPKQEGSFKIRRKPLPSSLPQRTGPQKRSSFTSTTPRPTVQINTTQAPRPHVSAPNLTRESQMPPVPPAPQQRALSRAQDHRYAILRTLDMLSAVSQSLTPQSARAETTTRVWGRVI